MVTMLSLFWNNQEPSWTHLTNSKIYANVSVKREERMFMFHKMHKNSLNACYMDLKPQDLYILAPVRKLFPLELLLHNCYVREMLTNRFLNGPVLQTVTCVPPSERLSHQLCKISQNSRLTCVRFGQCLKDFWQKSILEW